MSGTRHSDAFEVVAMVGSQGATAVACDILSRLPRDFPAAVIYVQHRAATSGSDVLADITRRRASLPVSPVVAGRPVTPGVIHVPAADAQTLVTGDRRFAVREGRCLGDPLFASVAATYGPRCIGVILSGRLEDGAIGLRRIKKAGGRVLVQDPWTAAAASMPHAALATGCYDFVLDPERIADGLTALVCVAGAAELLTVRPHPLLARDGP